MDKKSSFSAKGSAMPDTLALSRSRVEYLAGPSGWFDTKESRRARAARLIGTTARRVRAILAGDKVKLSADEYFAIEAAYERARHSLESLSVLARDADAESHSHRISPTGSGLREGERASAPARGGPAAGIQVRR